MDIVDLLKFLAPEFEDLAQGILEQAITLAAQRISAKAFGALYPQASALMAAHILERSRGRTASAGLSGPVTSVREGDLAISSQVLTGFDGADASLASTKYGAQYLELRETIPTSPFS